MKRYISVCSALVFLILLSFASLSHAALAGKISLIQGRVDVLKPGKNIAAPVKAGDQVDIGDIYRAKSDGRAEIIFLNNNVLKIASNTRAEIKEAMLSEGKSSTVIKLHRGRVQAISSEEFAKKVAAFAEGNKFEVHTPNAIAGIRGSNKIVSYLRGITGTLFITGRGYMFNPNDPQRRMVTIIGGHISFIASNFASPTLPRIATDREMATQVNAFTFTVQPEGAPPGGTAPGAANDAPFEASGLSGTAPAPTTSAPAGTEVAGTYTNGNIATVIMVYVPPEPAHNPPTPTPTPTTSFKSNITYQPLWYYAYSLYYPYSLGWQSGGSISATLEGTGSLWTQGTPVPVTMTGQDTGSGSGGYGAGKIVSAVIYSQNNSNTNKITSDGGAYYGILGGSGVNDNATAKIASLYIDPLGNAGYIKGTLTGPTNTGAGNTFVLDGTISSAPITSNTGILPENLYASINTFSYPGNAISGSGSFAAGGAITNISIRDNLYYRGIPNQPWGIWDTQLGFTYGPTTGNDWTISLNMDSSYKIDRLEIAGTQWLNNKLEGTAGGYGAGRNFNNEDGRTWLYFGDIVGSFNPLVYTTAQAQAVLNGVGMDSNKFLELAATDAGRTSLQQLNIPCIEVGSADLSGAGNNLTVAMNNVKFFSTTAGSAPQVWATGNVNGTYTAAPLINQPVNLSGSGLTADFNVSRWDIPTNRWVAAINNGTGNLGGGTYTGPVLFQGAAAGSITPSPTGAGLGTLASGAGTFSGTAAGIAKAGALPGR